MTEQPHPRASAFKPIVGSMVSAIVANRLDSLNYLPGRTTREGLADVLRSFALPLVDLPDEAFDDMRIYDWGPAQWYVEIPLWTADGRSDLGVFIEIHEREGKLVAYLDDLHPF